MGRQVSAGAVSVAAGNKLVPPMVAGAAAMMAPATTLAVALSLTSVRQLGLAGDLRERVQATPRRRISVAGTSYDADDRHQNQCASKSLLHS
jgi:hypothetical protein